jgi:hypothetical protein
MVVIGYEDTSPVAMSSGAQDVRVPDDTSQLTSALPGSGHQTR